MTSLAFRVSGSAKNKKIKPKKSFRKTKKEKESQGQKKQFFLRVYEIVVMVSSPIFPP